VFIGLVSSLLPHTIGILFGRYVLKMEPLIVLGACAGAGTITAALRAVQDEAKSTVPALGYTVPYAIGNILLTAWGPVLVAMMSIGNRRIRMSIYNDFNSLPLRGVSRILARSTAAISLLIGGAAFAQVSVRDAQNPATIRLKTPPTLARLPRPVEPRQPAGKNHRSPT